MVTEYEFLVKKHICPGFRLAEIGVWLGDSAVGILPLIRSYNGTYVAVDNWEDSTLEQFQNIISPWKDICEVRTGISWEIASEFPDKSFDFVFIDASHKYSAVLNDIRAWLPKVKSGGIIAGHDFNSQWDGSMENTDNEVSEREHTGVTRAVTEVFGMDGFTHFSVDENLAAFVKTWFATV